ncbi:MAG: ABC transporter ATP-binding protein [Peptococcaceae bacterium]
MENYVVEMEKLSCKSGRKYLLQDIDWKIRSGEHWLVFGMNGSGKTTLLSVLTGFQNYTHGTLKVFGEAYTQENILNHRRKIGWVSSSFFDKCYHKEQVLQIVLSGVTGTLNVDDSITDEDLLKAKTLLDKFGILDKQDMPFHFLSKGERQNVLLARALLGDPELIILDEPGTGLDVLAREQLLHMVCDLATEANKTIIYVTHYLEEIEEPFDHCLLLKNGRIYQKGKTRELFTSEIMTQFFNQTVTIQTNNDGNLYMKL